MFKVNLHIKLGPQRHNSSQNYGYCNVNSLAFNQKTPYTIYHLNRE